MKTLLIIMFLFVLLGSLKGLYDYSYKKGFYAGMSGDIESELYQEYMRTVYVPHYNSQNHSGIYFSQIDTQSINISGNSFIEISNP